MSVYQNYRIYSKKHIFHSVQIRVRVSPFNQILFFCADDDTPFWFTDRLQWRRYVTFLKTKILLTITIYSMHIRIRRQRDVLCVYPKFLHSLRSLHLWYVLDIQTTRGYFACHEETVKMRDLSTDRRLWTVSVCWSIDVNGAHARTRLRRLVFGLDFAGRTTTRRNSNANIFR